MSWRTFNFRILEAAWGIAIDVTARATFGNDKPAGRAQVSERVFLDASVIVGTADRLQLTEGLKQVVGAIQDRIAADEFVTIEVSELNYTPTDYQPDGVAAAILGWAIEEFELDAPMPEVTFDTATNRYVFTPT